jgi:hypothetical protein
MWNVGRPPAYVGAAFDAVYQRIAPGLDEHSVLLGRGDKDRFEVATDALDAVGLFGGLSKQVFPWTCMYTTGEWLDHLPSHSDHASLAPAHLARLLTAVGAIIDSMGGAFEMGYETLLLTATRS